MSRSTTTTEEFDTEGNLIRRTVEVWEDDPKVTEDSVGETPEKTAPIVESENDKIPNSHAVRVAGIDYPLLVDAPWFRTYDSRQNTPIVSFWNTVR